MLNIAPLVNCRIQSHSRFVLLLYMAQHHIDNYFFAELSETAENCSITATTLGRLLVELEDLQAIKRVYKDQLPLRILKQAEAAGLTHPARRYYQLTWLYVVGSEVYSYETLDYRINKL